MQYCCFESYFKKALCIRIEFSLFFLNLLGLNLIIYVVSDVIVDFTNLLVFILKINLVNNHCIIRYVL
jgi:hypothetical protein